MNWRCWWKHKWQLVAYDDCAFKWAWNSKPDVPLKAVFQYWKCTRCEKRKLEACSGYRHYSPIEERERMRWEEWGILNNKVKTIFNNED